MEISGADLEPSLRVLALALAEAGDIGQDHSSIRDHLLGVLPGHDGDPAIVEDVVLAASAQLAGVEADLAGLVAVWGEESLTRTAMCAARVVRLLRPPA